MTPSGVAGKKEGSFTPGSTEAAHGAREETSGKPSASLGLGGRLALELACLLGLLLVEVGWWHVRGRYSVAPESSELVDGIRFVGLTGGIYLSARIVLYVLGKVLSVVHQAGSMAVVALWTVIFGLGAGGLYVSGLGAELLVWGQKNVLGDNLTAYLIAQVPEFRKEGFVYLRLVVLLLFWQCVFGIIYWTGALLLLPFRMLFSPRSRSKPGTTTATPED